VNLLSVPRGGPGPAAPRAGPPGRKGLSVVPRRTLLPDDGASGEGNHELQTPGTLLPTRTDEADVGLAFRTDTGQVALGGGLDLEVWFAIK
jgi:hypothetical protein